MSNMNVPGALRELREFSKEQHGGKITLLEDWQGRPAAARYHFSSSDSSESDSDGDDGAKKDCYSPAGGMQNNLGQAPKSQRRRVKPPGDVPQTHAGQFIHVNPAKRHPGFGTDSGSSSSSSEYDDDDVGSAASHKPPFSAKNSRSHRKDFTAPPIQKVRFPGVSSVLMRLIDARDYRALDLQIIRNIGHQNSSSSKT